MARKIIAVIPCKNEARAICEVAVKAAQYVDRVVVVDNGSTDGTEERARSAGAHVTLCETPGAGAATAHGIGVALRLGADVIVMLDGDGQHDPDEIRAVAGPVMNGRRGLVVGMRVISGECMSDFRRVGNRLLSWACNVGARGGAVDTQCGYRAMDAATAQVVTPGCCGFGFATEQLVLARKHKVRVYNVPVRTIYLPEDGMNHTIGGWQHAFGVLWETVKCRVRVELCGRG